jgi:hypothetical protein
MSHLFKGPRLRAGVYFLTVLAAVSAATRQAGAQSAAPTVPATTPPTPGAPTAPAATPSPPPAAPAETTAPPPAATPPDAATPAPAPDASSTDTGGEVSTGSGLFESAQGDEGDSGVGEAPAASGFDLNGYVRGDVFIGKRPAKGQGEIKAGYAELSLKFRLRKEKYGDAFAEPRIRYGLQGAGKGVSVDLREAYVNLYAGPLDLRLGQQIVVWGRADALNPTSNITPSDLRVHSPVEDDRRVGNVGLRAFLNLSPFRLEGVWMPLYAATEIPDLPMPEDVNWGPTQYPHPALNNGLEGARLHLELPSVELSVSYLYGHAPLPGLALNDFVLPENPDQDNIITPSVLISRKAYNQHVVGFDFATTLGDWLGLRGELAYRNPLHFRERVHAPNPDVQYVLGVDHTFDEVSVIAQYIGRYTINWRRQLGPAEPIDIATALNGFYDGNVPAQAYEDVAEVLEQKNQMLFSQLRQVQNLASLRLEWLTLHQTLSVSALGLMNFSTQEWLVFPKVGYQVSDNLSTTVGAEIYAGPHDTLFGVIDSNLSAGYAELKMSF